MPSTRRFSKAERQATKRFIAMLMEEYPTVARLAYPILGEDGTVYIKVLIDTKYQREIFEVAAAWTGLIAAQEGIQVLLLNEDETIPREITSNEEFKALQVAINNHVQILQRLRYYKDAEAQWQRLEYLSRLKSHYDTIVRYLVT
ncbi:MAG: hypothetical protein AB1489_01745 [Acidobacteriota bacterium]